MSGKYDYLNRYKSQNLSKERAHTEPNLINIGQINETKPGEISSLTAK